MGREHVTAKGRVAAGLGWAAHLVAVVLACTAELQKSVRVSGSLQVARHAENGMQARGTGGGGAPEDSASSRSRSASCSSSEGGKERGRTNERTKEKK